MGALNFSVISIGEQQGTTKAATGGSFVAIPTMSNGVLPKYLRVLCTGGSANTRVFVHPSNTSSAAGSQVGFPMDAHRRHPIIMNVHGCSVLRYSRAGGGTSTIWMYPLEDF